MSLVKNMITSIAARDYYHSINTEELNTYFKELEGILNWQPLTEWIKRFDYLSTMSLLNSAITPSVLPRHILKSESLKMT